jgi:hypothetical protein
VDIDALTALAGNTIVAAAVTDAFEGMRAAVARLFGRDRPDAVIQRRLDETRQQLATTAPGQLEGARATQVHRWEARFQDLLADHPEAAEELGALVAELRSAAPDTSGNVTNTISGTVLGGSVLMGRDFGDVTIGRRDDLPSGG